MMLCVNDWLIQPCVSVQVAMATRGCRLGRPMENTRSSLQGQKPCLLGLASAGSKPCASSEPGHTLISWRTSISTPDFVHLWNSVCLNLMHLYPDTTVITFKVQKHDEDLLQTGKLSSPLCPYHKRWRLWSDSKPPTGLRLLLQP